MKYKSVYVLTILVLLAGIIPANAAPAARSDVPVQSNTCDQAALDQAEAAFLSRLSDNGQVPVDDPVAEAAAVEYIRLSKLCYDEMLAERGAQAVQGGDTVFIDDGPVDRYVDPTGEFVVSDPLAKWGSSTLGTSGGIVTYSFMGSGLDLSNESVPGYGNSVAITALNNFQLCFLTDIRNAFAAWSAVSDIKFVETTDSNTAFDAVGATGDIRVGAHAFDGTFGTLAHAYLPYNYLSGDGDIHFDKDENWSCTTSGGFDIGLVALHEIGHSIGLFHENTSTVAVMDPSYNSSLTTLQSDDAAGAQAIYGAPPLELVANDDFASATLINNISFTDSLNTTTATADVTDPDNVGPCDGNYMNHGKHTVWYKYTPTVNESIAVDTAGSDFDTYLAVWTGTEGSLSLVTCDDDSITGYTSELSFLALAGTPYYFEVSEFNGFEPLVGDTTDPAGNMVFNVNITNTDVTIGTDLMGKYYVYSGSSSVHEYATANGGPVVVANTVGGNTIASLIQFRRPGFSGEWTGITQTMALTDTQISDKYVIPHYDFADSTKYNSLQLANLDSIDTNISVVIGGVLRGTYAISAGSSQNVTFPGVTGGPVVVESDNGAQIVATLYELKRPGSTGLYTGQTTMMGLPWAQLSDTYIIPRYNHIPQDILPYIVFANADSVSTNVTVTIGGSSMGTYPLAPGQSSLKEYTTANGGPVVISSNNGAKIIASLLQLRRPGFSGSWTGITQTMALTDTQISDKYAFPYYDFSDPTKYNSLQLANFDSIATNISVEIGGVLQGTYPLSAGSSQNVTFPDVTGGPVVVSSDNGAQIIVSLYELKRAGITGLYTGQTQMMGLPWAQLSDTYIIPRYNHIPQDILPYIVFANP